MKNKFKIFALIYFIVLGFVVFGTKDLSKVLTGLEYIACGTATKIPKPMPQLTTVAFTLLITATPLVLIVMSIVTLVKAISSGNIEDVTKAKSKLLKKVIVTIIIFLVSGMVQFVLNRVTSNDEDKSSVASCLRCFLYYSSNNCPAVKYDSVTATGMKYKSHSNDANKIQPKSNSDSSSNSSNSSSNGTVKTDAVILVGDSRTVQMCKSTTEINGGTCRDYIAVARGGMGAAWFRDTAVSNVNKILNNNKSKKYTIIILMGANDVGATSGSEANSVSIYKSQLKSLAKGDWKNHVIKFAKTTCGDQTMARNNGMTISQEQIDNFNKQIKSFINSANISNLKYCDIKDVPKSNLVDGVHYTAAGSDFYYKQIKSKCAK